MYKFLPSFSIAALSFCAHMEWFHIHPDVLLRRVQQCSFPVSIIAYSFSKLPFAAVLFSTSSDEDRNMFSLLANLFGRPWRDGPERPLTESGNSVRRGVRAAATLRADRRRVSRTFHSRFFAMKNKVAVETGVDASANIRNRSQRKGPLHLLPMMVTTTTTTMMAIKPPVEMDMEFLELSPDAPASVPVPTPGARSLPASEA